MRVKVFGVLVFALLSLGLATGAARAQSGSLGEGGGLTLVSDIPFGFIVENTTLPAGKYELMQSADDPLVWTLADVKGAVKVIFMTEPAEKMNPPRSYELTFDEGGGKYFLGDIWLASDADGFHIAMTKAQKAFLKGTVNPRKERVPLKKKGM